MSVSYHSANGLDYGGSTRVASASYDNKKGASYNYVGKDLVSYIVSEKPVPASPPNGKRAWLWTNWCGPGGGGPSTGAVDDACIAHDATYGAAGEGGTLAAIANGKWALVSADFTLAVNATLGAPQDIFRHPSSIFSGPAVGGAFALIGAYKTAGNLARGVGY
jgi:hypothetical protein